MDIVKLKLSDIKPYEKNAKLHPDWQIEQIKKSIKDFGNNDPIAVWGKDNVIVEGHGRYEALKQLGYDEAECIRLDQLSDAERRAYMLVHNKTTMNSGFQKDVLMDELNDLIDIDMLAFGFDLEDMKENEMAEKPEVEFTEVLGEEHNYVVLYFDNAVDWLQMESILDCEGKMNLSTRKDGRVGKNMKRISVGRVFRGADALESMRKHFENLH